MVGFKGLRLLRASLQSSPCGAMTIYGVLRSCEEDRQFIRPIWKSNLKPEISANYTLSMSLLKARRTHEQRI